jgi:hypothetical protein
MSLPAGTRLGPYEVLSPLGAGGMGEVITILDFGFWIEMTREHGSATTRSSLALAHIYGNIFLHMKTTIDLPDELLIEAKKRAAESRTTLREIFERGLRHELADRRSARMARKIHWVTARGGLPEGLDVRDRARMQEWIRSQR